MMGDRVGYGSLSKNERKEKDTHKDFQGQITVEHHMEPGKYWLAGWTKEGDDGRRWISLSVETQTPSRGAPPARAPAPPPRSYPPRAAAPPAQNYDDDMIPF